MNRAFQQLARTELTRPPAWEGPGDPQHLHHRICILAGWEAIHLDPELFELLEGFSHPSDQCEPRNPSELQRLRRQCLRLRRETNSLDHARPCITDSLQPFKTEDIKTEDRLKERRVNQSPPEKDSTSLEYRLEQLRLNARGKASLLGTLGGSITCGGKDDRTRRVG